MSKSVIALMGKAGSGKDTILHTIMKKCPNTFNEIVSCTTRPPREGEVDGVNYYFITEEEFAERIKRGDMLEYTGFNGWFYGTDKSQLSDNKANIGVFNPTGIRALQQDPTIALQVYYVRAPAKQRLLRQLNREEDPNVKEIIRRFSADEKDFCNIFTIDFCELQNDVTSDLEKCANVVIGQTQLNLP